MVRGVEDSPEELGALEEGEVGGLGKGLIGQLFRGRGHGTPLCLFLRCYPVEVQLRQGDRLEWDSEERGIMEAGSSPTFCGRGDIEGINAS